MVKVNFSGGEPFLPKRGIYLGEMVKFCKESLQLPSVSIVSNGSLVTEAWFQEFGQFLDILAISCDSFDADVNERIGRQQGGRDHLRSLQQVHEWCRTYKVLQFWLSHYMDGSRHLPRLNREDVLNRTPEIHSIM